MVLSCGMLDLSLTSIAITPILFSIRNNLWVRMLLGVLEKD